jgi:tetratricopeptide (TPR) repeat protein
MTLAFRNFSAATVVVAVGLSMASAGCGRYSFSNLKAQKAYKTANERYRAQDWRNAADRYEAVLAANPERHEVLFFLGNSYDNMYKPALVGQAENDSYMQKALENYKKAAQLDKSPEMRKLALQYLVAAYGTDKLNRPDQAEPVVQEMIKMDPGDPANYAALSKIYEEAGRYEDAEAALLKARDAKPNDAAVHQQIAGFYNRTADFAKTMEHMQKAAELDGSNPLGFYTLATYYEEKVRKDFRITPVEKREYIRKGIEATDRALKINPDYSDALAYKNIMLRHQMRVETDRGKQQELEKEADRLRNRAIELNKKKTAGGK